MDEVVDLRGRVVLRLGEADAAFDRFLLDVGLDLLASFRLIADPAVHAAVREMVGTIAAAPQPATRIP